MSLEQCRSGDGVPISIISDAFFTRGVFTTKAHADNMIGSIDTDRSGALSYEEFMAAIDGSNLMQAGRIRKFLRSLVKEYPDIQKFYEARPSTVDAKKSRHKGAKSSRIVPTEEDVNKLHYLKSREAMMKMGVQFPTEEEEGEDAAGDKPTVAPVEKHRPSTAGAMRSMGVRQGSANAQREGGSNSRPTSGTIRRYFRSDETHDHSQPQLPTIDISFTRRLDDIREAARETGTPLAKAAATGSFFGRVENDKYITLSTATPADVMLSDWGPSRQTTFKDLDYDEDDDPYLEDIWFAFLLIIIEEYGKYIKSVVLMTNDSFVNMINLQNKFQIIIYSNWNFLSFFLLLVLITGWLNEWKTLASYFCYSIIITDFVISSCIFDLDLNMLLLVPRSSVCDGGGCFTGQPLHSFSLQHLKSSQCAFVWTTLLATQISVFK
jgi:hypothetical protein